MKIVVTVHTRKKDDRIERLPPDGKLASFLVSTRAARESGRANDAVREIIAQHFSVPPSCVKIIRGHTSSHKLVEILL